jgi:hypothetical protein
MVGLGDYSADLGPGTAFDAAYAVRCQSVRSGTSSLAASTGHNLVLENRVVSLVPSKKKGQRIFILSHYFRECAVAPANSRSSLHAPHNP